MPELYPNKTRERTATLTGVGSAICRHGWLLCCGISPSRGLLLLLATEDWMVVAALEAVVFEGAPVTRSAVMELPAETLWEI